MPELSVIIPVKDRLLELRDLLKDLDRQECPNFEVLVVDDGSRVPVADEVSQEAFSFSLRIIRLTDNMGIGYARNVGIRAARGHLIVFIDSDGRVTDPGWLAAHKAFHAGVAAETVLGGKVRGIHRTYAGRTFYYSNWFTSCAKRAHPILDHHVPMHNASIPKSVFDKVGLFDEDLEVAEDVEWSFRCLKQGIHLFYSPSVAVGHKDRDTWPEVIKSYRKMGRFAHLVRKKRKDSPYQELFPSSRIMAYFYFFPLTIMMTAYIALAWLPVDPRVLVYIPGMYVANVAYYLGIMDSLRPLPPDRN